MIKIIKVIEVFICKNVNSYKKYGWRMLFK